MVDDLAVGLVETGGQVLLGESQSDGVGDTLPQRACGEFQRKRSLEEDQ